MKQIKAATGEYVEGDIQEQDRQEFKDARIFVCPNTIIPIECNEPEDTAKVKTLDLDAVANVNCRLDALQGKIKDLTKDNKDSKQELAESKDKLATWQKLSEEREAAIDDIQGWLVTNDTKYMDRLRLRQNNLGQARLDLLQSQHAGASRTVHPAQVDSTTYSEVAARQPDDQQILIQAFIDYSLKFRP